MVFDEVIARFGDATEPILRQTVTIARRGALGLRLSERPRAPTPGQPAPRQRAQRRKAQRAARKRNRRR